MTNLRGCFEAACLFLLAVHVLQLLPPCSRFHLFPDIWMQEYTEDGLMLHKSRQGTINKTYYVYGVLTVLVAQGVLRRDY